MAKWYIIFGGIAGNFVAIFHLLLILQVTELSIEWRLDYNDTDITVLEAINGAAYTSMLRLTPFMLLILLNYLLMFYYMITLFPLKKWFITLGAIISMLGGLTIVISWFFGLVYDPPFIIGGNLFSIGWLIVGFGFISFAKHSTLTAILGPIMSMVTILVYAVLPVLCLINASEITRLELEGLYNMHFLAQAFYCFFFFTFTILFGIFFKERFYFDGEREEISVLEQTAFATYLPDEPETPGRKKHTKKKKQVKEKIDFNF